MCDVVLIHSQIGQATGMGPEVRTNAVQRLLDTGVEVEWMQTVQHEQRRYLRGRGQGPYDVGPDEIGEARESRAVVLDEHANELFGGGGRLATAELLHP